jgi:WD40 repeat protein
VHLPWPPRLPRLRKRSEPRKTCHHGGTLPLANQLARADLKARLFGAPAESTRVGRYAVLRRLGAGGMGVVYVAYDEELGRKIALKLVHPGHHDPDASARSRREAQALARLSHPNVVQVYEVGEYQGQVYLAMEFVPGQTLRAWQAQAPRAWRDLVGMYLQAGRGLAAAHARGLVHRDFKPENVLVGDDDQRPRVLDFGLARVPGLPQEPGDMSHETSSSDLSSGTDRRDPDARLTTPGAVIGTPAYMAPEQLDGGDADPRSDIFSFCTALHEALHGVRPYTGDTRTALRAAIARGAPSRPRAAELPAWLQRVVERGLAPDPGERWPAMDPLLAALTRDPTRWRRRAALALVLLTLLAAGVHTLLAASERQQARALADKQARLTAATAELVRSDAARAHEQRRSDARRLAILAGQHADSDPQLRLLLAVEAVALHTREGALPIVEAEQALLDAQGEVRSTPYLRPGAGLVDTVAESPDGHWLATGERDGSLTLWSTADPHTPHTLHAGDGHEVHALAFRPDSRRLAALRRADGGPRVWTLPPVPSDTSPVPSDIPPPAQWPCQLPDLRDLEWHPRGDALLARSPALAVVLRPDAPALTLPHPAPLRRATWSPDGAQVLTAATDGGARLWPARGGEPRLIRLPGASHPLGSAEFSPDGSELALASADHSAAIVPLAGGATQRLRGHTAPVYIAAFTPDKRLVTVAMDDSARIWERDGSSTRVALPGHSDALAGVRIGPDRNLLLGTPPGGAAWLWQLDRPGPPLVLHGHRGSVVAARFSADGRRLLTASTDGSARVWHFADDPAVLRGHDAGIEHASFAPDGRSILTASMDGTTRIWPRDGRPPTVLRGHREGSSVSAAISPDGHLLATAASDGLARLWSLASTPPTLLATLPPEPLRGPPLGTLAWGPDARHLALGGDDGTLFLTTLSPEHHPTTVAHPGHTAAIRALAFTPDAVHLATAGDDGTLRLWDLRRNPITSTVLAEAVPSDSPTEPVPSDSSRRLPIRSLAFTQGGATLLSAGDDATARVWSLADPGPPRLLQGHLRAIWQVTPFPQQHAILTASADATARLWPADGGAPQVLSGHADAVWVAVPSPDGSQIATISSDGTARLWRLRGEETTSLLLPHRGTAPGLGDDTLWTGGISPDGRHLLTAGADGIARVFPITLADLLAEACARAGRNLSQDEWTRLVGPRAYQPACPEAGSPRRP